MNRDKYNIPFEMPDFPEVSIGEQIFSAKEYSTISGAVEACKKAGGGTVVVEAGIWHTGPLHLGSHMCLHLEEGAEVHFSTRFEDYLPVVFTRWEGMECYNYSPLIYAKDCEDIRIAGKGKLIGGGEAWWHWKQLQQAAANELCYAQSEGIPVEKRIYGTVEAALRPSFIQFVDCKNIVLEDFTVEEGPQWTLHPVYCEMVQVQNVTVHTIGHNTDGLNPDSCKNVWLEGCKFATGDDCIAINAGMNEDGWRVNRPCENIVIVDCEMSAGHGAIVIGSGMSGGVSNVYAANCRIGKTDQGIRLKSMRGRGGYVKNVWCEDIVLEGTTQQAVQISMFYPYSTVVPKSNTPSLFTDIHVKNVIGSCEGLGLEIRGLPEKRLQNITLENIHLAAPKGIYFEHTENLTMLDVDIHP